MKKLYLLLLVCVAALIMLFGFTPFTASSESLEGSMRPLGNHSLQGSYEFHADGVIEIDGEPTRGIWEVGRFDADGKGNITNGVEYSSLLSSSDETIIDQNFTFEGTYTINADGIGKATVSVTLPNGFVIEKSLWLVLHSVGKNGIANGFAGGHADADLGEGVHGNSRTHVGWRINTSK